MNTVKRKSEYAKRVKAWFFICPVAHCAALAAIMIIALHLATRHNHALMVRLSQDVVRPVHMWLAQLCANTQASVAEIIIAALVVLVVARLVYGAVRLLRRKSCAKRVYRLIMGLLAGASVAYAGFCLLWGVYYYGDDFISQSGLNTAPVSTAQLEVVTEYFAALANDCVGDVQRDENGFYICDKADVLRRSKSLFDNTVDEFPCLTGVRVSAKGVKLSRAMSYIDFTGFFFPFTAEANVNTDFPSALFASTVAHELSHQRGVAKEQEANFVAVLASMRTEDSDFRYSAALLAYTHLGNALHSADYQAWERIYTSLDDNVKRDLALNNAYWRQFDTPVQSVSNTVYEGFLQSYEQTLGLKSYGACVDLLVNYYYAPASE